MKVLQINTLLRGGAGKAVQRLHSALLDSGVDSGLLTLERSEHSIPSHHCFPDLYPTWQQAIMRQRARLDRFYHRLVHINRPKGYEPFRHPYSVFDVTRHPAWKQADLIHLHWIPGFVDIPDFFKKTDRPIVWTLHDMWPFTGGYFYEKGFPFQAYQRFIGRYLAEKQKAYQGKNLHLVTLSNWLEQHSRMSAAFQHFSHTHILNSLDTKIFTYVDKKKARQLLGLPEEGPYVLFVSDYLDNPRKGLHFLLDALKTLSLSGLKLLVIGKARKGLPQDGQMTLFGAIKDDNKLALIYAAADAFVLPSVEDNLPNTIAEAHCCGTPVLAFRVGGIPEMIQPYQNGLLADQCKADSLAEIISEFLTIKDQFDAGQIAEQGKTQYSPLRQANEMTALYTSVLTQTGNKNPVD